MNKLYKLLMVGMLGVSLFGCASMDRLGTDIKSDMNGGLNRIINVYTADGKIIASYEGRIDIETNDGGYVKFDYDGKRYVYYNCFVETIADK
jgi:hypothetical protein